MNKNLCFALLLMVSGTACGNSKHGDVEELALQSLASLKSKVKMPKISDSLQIELNQDQRYVILKHQASQHLLKLNLQSMTDTVLSTLSMGERHVDCLTTLESSLAGKLCTIELGNCVYQIASRSPQENEDYLKGLATYLEWADGNSKLTEKLLDAVKAVRSNAGVQS